MSSSYSSLDWVLSHWVHFTVHRFISVYLCILCVFVSLCIVVLLWTVGWTWWDWSLTLKTLSSFSACFDIVSWIIWPVKTRPDITYNVFGGTLNLAQSIIFVSSVRLHSQNHLKHSLETELASALEKTPWASSFLRPFTANRRFVTMTSVTACILIYSP